MNITVIWLILLVVLIVIELATMGLTTIWFAGGALFATIAAACGAPVFLQITLFFGVAVILLIFTRPIAIKYFNKERVKTNAEGLVSKQAIVTGNIDNMQGIGQVTILGQEWSARSNKEEIAIPVGAVVTVLAIQGVKLIVEERKEEN